MAGFAPRPDDRVRFDDLTGTVEQVRGEGDQAWAEVRFDDDQKLQWVPIWLLDPLGVTSAATARFQGSGRFSGMSLRQELIEAFKALRRGDATSEQKTRIEQHCPQPVLADIADKSPAPSKAGIRTTTAAKAEAHATEWFLKQVQLWDNNAPLWNGKIGKPKKEEMYTAAVGLTPNLSGTAFKMRIWALHAPPEWKRPGAPKGPRSRD
jgi:hypothetical protein